MSVTVKEFGKLEDGRTAYLYTIENRAGMKAVLTDFGAVLICLLVPDKNGKLTDVVLGFDELEKYEDNFDMQGATVGRNVNRIEKGKFRIDGIEYQLEINENDNNIHSSMSKGFHKVLWTAESFSDDSVSFSYHSPDMENGFPGNLDISLTYTLTDPGALILSYYGVSDKKTLVNLTNHSYFNLSGYDSGNILDTVVWINADQFTPVRAGTIPTGEIWPVENTPMDFRKPKPVSQDIGADYEQLKLVYGYDHNFVLRGAGKGLRKAALAWSPRSEITMTVYTDLPGLQFYTGNTTRDIIGKGGALITKNSGFCMESHYFPNSINIPWFPQPVLEKGALYKTTTIYQFS